MALASRGKAPFRAGCVNKSTGLEPVVLPEANASVAEQLQYLLGQLVGLRHHRRAGLLQDLRA